MRKLLLIINPVAGMKKVNKFLTDIIVVFSEAGYVCQVYPTTKDFSADKIVKNYGEDANLVVCIGGDGTFNEVVTGCLQLKNKPHIGYIPSGSTNDFANGMKLPLDPVEAAKNIVSKDPTNIDVGTFNDRIFTYIASFGVFTKASYSTPRDLKNTFGYLAYALHGIKEITEIKKIDMIIEAQDRIIEDSFIFGGICNSKRIGGGLIKFSEELVDMNDGLLEVFLIKYPKNTAEFMQLVFDLNTENFNSPMFEFFSTDNLKITADSHTDWTIDGEYQKGSEIIEISNKKSAISLII